MNRNFVFVIILLTALSTVNTIPSQLHKRVTVFEPCSVDPPVSVTQIQPDPLIPGGTGKFFYNGKLADTIPVGSVTAVQFYNLASGTPELIGFFTADLCTPKGI